MIVSTGATDRVTITEVGPRDGLQALSVWIPTDRKIRLVSDLVATGLHDLEVASFVNPARVPQMRDGRDVLSSVPRSPGVRYAALVPNLRGFQDAQLVSPDRIAVVTAASEVFQQRNMNSTIEASFQRIEQIVDAARGGPMRIRGYISTVTDCPYSGPVDPARVAVIAERLLSLGCHEVCLGETIGKGTVATVSRMLDAVLAVVPADRLGLHFHDTYGQALANIIPGLERGIRMIDSSLAGLGGCPFAPGAAGNVATEDVVYLLRGLGLAPSPAVDLERIAFIGESFCHEFGLTHQSKAGHALMRAVRPNSLGE